LGGMQPWWGGLRGGTVVVARPLATDSQVASTCLKKPMGAKVVPDWLSREVDGNVNINYA